MENEKEEDKSKSAENSVDCADEVKPSAASDPSEPPSVPETFQGEEVKKYSENVTLIGKVKVQKKPEILGATEDYKSEDEEDEELPPRLRFITPADVLEEEDEVDNPDTEEVYYIGTSGQKVTVVTGLEHLRKLKLLCLRSNFIRQVTELSTLTTLTSLELYENRIATLEGVETLVNLTNLDLSYNRLRSLDPAIFKNLVKLERLHVAQNKLTKIGPALLPLVNLKILDLGMNRIREIDGLETLGNLKELWLGKNKITEIKGLSALKKLIRMSIQSNRIVKIGDGLKDLVSLEELYLSHQGIEKVEGLDTLAELNTLDLTHNKLTSTEGIPAEKLPKLEELWMSENQIPNFEEVERLSPLTKLQTIYLEHNPVAKEFDYRMRLAKIFPTLTQIDAVRRR